MKTIFKAVRRLVPTPLAISLALPAFAATTIATVFGPEQLTGSLGTTKKVTKTFAATPGIQTAFRIEAVNADGKDHSQRNCNGLSTLKKLTCSIENVAQALYIATIRVQWAEVTINGQKVITRTEFSSDKISLTKTVSLNASNSMTVEYKSGLLISYFSLKIESEKTEVPNQNPIANFSHTTATDLGTLSFTANASSSTDPDGQISEYIWNFGDGSTANGVNAQHEYQQPGTFNVSLTVRDNRGATNTKTQAVVVEDKRAPVITAQNLPSGPQYVRALPANYTINVTSDESLSYADVNGQTLGINGGFASGAIALDEGSHSLVLRVRDRWGNETTKSSSISLTYDGVAPRISSLAANITTNRHTYDIPVAVEDISATTTEVTVNGDKVFITGSKNFTYNISLNNEGPNTIQLKSTDMAGNEAPALTFQIIRDTTLPEIQISSPLPNASLGSVLVPISGTANEPLVGATANGMVLSLSSDKKSFSGTYLAPGQGPHPITFQAVDIAGNISTVTTQVEITSTLLVKELVSINPRGETIWILGGQGAARPGLEISASVGIFSTNRDSTVVSPNGSFALKLGPFSQATLSIEDNSTNESDSMALQLVGESRLSGVVKDVDDNPLPGVTVSIVGTAFSTTTTGTGAFAFSGIPTGDQVLSIDGRTVPQSVTGVTRSFSALTMKVNIGVLQANVIPTTIYLTPLMLDGTQTAVIANSSATITSPHAPNVRLELPANSATFPTGLKTGAINMMTIQADKTPIPPPLNARPTEVLSLEPSGLTFNQRIPISLPNVYDLPAATEMILVSMNSSTGQWEIDGLAKISEDGSSIQSRPGHGISHFSLVYAAPLAPTLRSIQNSKLGAYDSSKDAVEARVDLPSVKFGDNETSLGLRYKSTWARPTAYVSNIIDIPDQRLSFSMRSSASTSEYARVEVGGRCSYGWDGRGGCWALYNDYYANTFYERDIQYKSWYAPESIKSQFFIGEIRSNETVANSPPADESLSGLFSNGPYKGIISNELVSKLTPSLPLRSQISYAVELKKPNGEEYFDSGMYPSLARYEIKLKNFTLTTGTGRATQNVYVNTNYGSSASFSNVISYSNSTLSSSVLYDVFPQDVAANLVVQNKVRSPAGRGWHISGTQTILNPNSISPVIENETGEVQTYSLNNTIHTVYSPSSSSGITLNDKAVDLSRWPVIMAARKDASNFVRIVEDTAEGASNPTNIGTVNSENGLVTNRGRYTCIGTAGTYTATRSAFRYVPDITNILRLPDGTILGTDRREHSLFSLQNGFFAKMAGNWNTMETRNELPDVMNTWCTSKFGQACGTPTVFQSGISCATNPSTLVSIGNSVSTGFLGIGYGVGYPNGRTFPFSIGASSNRVVGLNSTSDLIVGPDGSVYIADTGNNEVYKFDRSSNTITWFAGSGENGNFPDTGGSALTMPLYHPKALAVDPAGQVYIATELGQIIKVDTNGTAKKIGGLPLSEGGVLATQGHVSIMAFNQPAGLAIDPASNDLYIADSGNNRVVRVNLDSGQADTIAGNGTCNLTVTGDNLPAAGASLCNPTKLAVDSSRNLIIQDTGHNSIRKVIFNRSTNNQLAFSPTNGDQSTLVQNADGSWVRTMRAGERIVFNASGRQTSTIDPPGNTTQFSYNASGALEKIRLATGQEFVYSYDGAGRLRDIMDSAGRKTEFSYSGDQLTRATFPDGTTKNFSYNDEQLLAKETNARGYSTSYTYNEYLRLASITKADQSQIQNQDVISSSIGSTQSEAPKELGGFGFEEGQAYSKVTDANGSVTKVVYSLEGEPALVESPSGEQYAVKSNTLGLVSEVTEANRLKTSFSYNSVTRDVIEVMKADLQTGKTRKHEYTYNSRGSVLTEKDSLGNQTNYSYDTSIGLLKTVQNDTRNLTISYNAAGLKISETENVAGIGELSTTYLRDAIGRVTKKTSPGGESVSMSYDLAGNVLSKTVQSSPSQSATTYYQYDSMNRMTQVTSPLNEVTKYSYNRTGDLETITSATGKTTHFEYDAMGRLTKKIEPSGLSSSYFYDGNGNRVREIDPKGQVKTYTYDSLNRMRTAQLPDDTFEYEYDSNGLMTLAQNTLTRIEFQNDAFGNLLISNARGRGSFNHPLLTLTYGYDANGNKTSMSSWLKTVNYDFGPLNTLTAIRSSNGSNYTFQYDSAKRLQQITRPGSSTIISRTPSGIIGNFQHYSGSQSLGGISLTFDSAMRPVTKTDFFGVTTISYDGNDQVKTITGPADGNEAFNFDQLGNRILDSSGNYVYDNEGRRLVSDENFIYAYDNNGNLLSKTAKLSSRDSQVYDYSSSNQLTRVRTLRGISGPLIRDTTFKYDALGRRVEKRTVDNENTSNSAVRQYVYDSQNILAEYDGTGSMLASYIHSPSEPDDILEVEVTSAGVGAGISTASGRFEYLKDNIGSVIAITNTNGAVIERYQYSLFGAIKAVTDSAGQQISTAAVNTPFKFTGREWDNETGLYYFRARYYDPNIGRFLQEDSDPGQIDKPTTVTNRYAYAGNSPQIYKDPTGRWFWVIVGLAATIGAVDVMHNNEWDITKILGGAARGAITAALAMTYFEGVDILTAVSTTAVAGAQAGSQTGSFVNNFWHFGSASYAMGFIAWKADYTLSAAFETYNIYVAPVLPALAIGAGLMDIRNAACDAKKGSWYGDGKCKN